MDTDLDIQVRQIQDRVIAAQRDHARAEQDYAAANRLLANTAQQLADEFGVTSLAAAQDLYVTLEQQLRVELSRINDELSQQVDTALPAS